MAEVVLNNHLPLISVAMATYNGSKYLSKQLESILNQTYKNIELVVVDDCSNDNTVELIDNYCQKYPWIKLVQNKANLGVIKSFEKAISLCNGDYIVLSDQDDIWFLHKLQVLIDNIDDNLLIHSDAELIDEDGKRIAKSHFNAAKVRDKSKFVDYLISNNVTGCTCLFSKHLVKLALPIPNEFYSHDHYLAIIASFYGKVKLINKALVYYRQHNNNVIGAFHPKFDQFLIECKKKADSYDSLLRLAVFKDNLEVELLRDYRRAIYNRKWQSRFNVLKLIHLKGGYKLISYYFFLVITPRYITERFYVLYIKYKYKIRT